MNSELMQYVQGTVVPAKENREVTQRARVIHDQVRLNAFRADGALALAGHIMEGVAQLDNHRRQLAGNDPITTALLVDIEQEAMNSVKSIQRSLYTGWRL